MLGFSFEFIGPSGTIRFGARQTRLALCQCIGTARAAAVLKRQLHCMAHAGQRTSQCVRKTGVNASTSAQGNVTHANTAHMQHGNVIHANTSAQVIERSMQHGNVIHANTRTSDNASIYTISRKLIHAIIQHYVEPTHQQDPSGCVRCLFGSKDGVAPSAVV